MKRSYCHIACLLVLSLLFACSKPPPDEQLIRQAMEKMQLAADNKRLADLMGYFRGNFLGRRGMPKRELQARIHFHFRINPVVRVLVTNTHIEIKQNQAQVTCHLLVTGAQQHLPERGRLYQITSIWQKQDGVWRVANADWQDVLEEFAR